MAPFRVVAANSCPSPQISEEKLHSPLLSVAATTPVLPCERNIHVREERLVQDNAVLLHIVSVRAPVARTNFALLLSYHRNDTCSSARRFELVSAKLLSRGPCLQISGGSGSNRVHQPWSPSLLDYTAQLNNDEPPAHRCVYYLIQYTEQFLCGAFDEAHPLARALHTPLLPTLRTSEPSIGAYVQNPSRKHRRPPPDL